MTPDANDLCVFAVKRGYIESKEIYCNPLYPTYLSLVEKYQHSPYANGILNNHVAVNPKTDCSLLSDSSEVSFVPMANVQEKTNVVSYDMVAYETVKKGFTVFQRGDLIWAKITPCMQNGKSCIVDKMPTEIGFGSTEFHVIRKRNEKVANAFYEDLGVHFKVLESVLHHLSDSSFSHDNVEFDEIAPNVIKAKATDVLNDYLSFVVENVPVEDVKSAYDFLTIVPGQLKTICDTTHPILPIWEREKRNHCFAVRPIYMSNNDYIYSPIIMEEVRKRWIEGFLQFYPPFEIGLERTCTALYAWKNNYEHLFSSEVEVLLKESGCEYAKHDVDLRREDRRGNHPTIDVLGDYDVIGLNTTQKRIFIIECKVLQPIGSVFEHSNQQKRFFTKEKFDEKFQKRIDYFSKVAMSFFANHGYDTEGFTINPYMVVNKVFSSYYKHVQFPIVTFDELKREIQL